MQAITYVAMTSQFADETLVEHYARFRSRDVSRSVRNGSHDERVEPAGG